MQIPLTQGLVAQVDDEDYPLVVRHKWCAHKCDTKTYATTAVSGRTVRMHQLILPGDHEVDHIDGDGLNNRRSNLRPATRQQNQVNSGARSGKYKGVSNQRGRWRARIKINGVSHELGIFDNEEDAARAYDAAALEAWGTHAFLNLTRR